MIKSLIPLLMLSTAVFGASRLKDMEQLRKHYGLSNFSPNDRLVNMKIAVLDNGFAGIERDPEYLPKSTKVVERYDAEFIKRNNLGDPEFNDGFQPTEHGRIMAQIVWAMTGLDERGPQFYLLNATGITNFRRAVRFAVEEKVDIILYSQNRECCGNFDGGGFLNDIVNQATRAGIIWINAAGNYGGRVFHGPMPAKGKTLRIKSHVDENPAQIILNWDSQGPDEESGTDKDLDLYLYDANNQLVARSELTQVLHKDKLENGETFLPRERIRADLNEGEYRIVVQPRSKNFNGQDQIRVTVIPEREPIFSEGGRQPVDAVQLLDRTQGREIMVPADNPSVITIGDINPYSAQGPTLDGRVKPEIILDRSDASFSDGRSSSGTSNAAAFFAGIVAVMKAQNPSLDRVRILREIAGRLPGVRLNSGVNPNQPQNPQNPNQPPVNPQDPSASGIRNVSFAELTQAHRPLLQEIANVLRQNPVLAGRYPDGHYVVGYTADARSIVEGVCRQALTANGERAEGYFLAYAHAPTLPPHCARGNRNILCCAKTADTMFPWEYFKVQPREFLQVRNATPQQKWADTEEEDAN